MAVASIFYIPFYTFIPLKLYPRRGSRYISDIPTAFYQIDVAMRNTAIVAGGKPIAV
jgi:hypothetical protein